MLQADNPNGVQPIVQPLNVNDRPCALKSKMSSRRKTIAQTASATKYVMMDFIPNPFPLSYWHKTAFNHLWPSNQ